MGNCMGINTGSGSCSGMGTGMAGMLF